MLLQDFKNCLPENVVVHLNEQKVTSLSNAAVLADEFVLTHRFSSASSVRHDRTRPSTTESSVKNTATRVFSQSNRTGGSLGRDAAPKKSDDRCVCFYCLDPGHLITDCKVWKQKNAISKTKPSALALCTRWPTLRIRIYHI